MSGVQKSKERLMAEILNLQVTTSILDNIIDVLWVKDLHGRYVMISESFALRYKKATHEVIGKTDFDIHPYHLAVQSLRNDNQVVQAGKKYIFLESELLADGTEQHFEVCKNPVYDFSGEIVGVLSVSRNITERKKMEENLIYISEHDGLTNLFNREYFEETPNRLLSQGITQIGLIICDVDGLKIINDTVGHRKGDEILIQVAKVLKDIVARQGTAARIGGDEFAVIIPHIKVSQLESLCSQIDSSIKKIDSGLGMIPLSVSCGYATTNLANETFDQLFKRVDDAMQKEKLLRNQSHRSALALTVKEMLKARDFLTEEHGDRLQHLVCNLAQQLNLPVTSFNELKLFAQFHDLGKIGISDQILFKPGPLTLEEKTEMCRHSKIGFRIAQSIPEFAVIADWVLKHHEWFDGSGYPLGLRGEEIPIECRILAIADAYDAMLSDRPYRKALSQEQAIAELLKYAGKQFDPYLVHKFIATTRW
ncbi:diguanylate cyclase domain-containing protein [Pelosinus sp. sgz500959]|uniref:diguanylate cyclase domain-containing protein n=1 Tax=Pelosinus sp. sgz500959 TaxID=3242472 RepID=UPI0036729103